MTAPKASLFNAVVVGGALMIFLSIGIRQSFGLFQIPIAEGLDWPRTSFSLAIALQNLAWGIGQPIFGAIAEKIGDRRAIVIGVCAYAGGLLLSAMSVSPLAHQVWQSVVGFGISGVSFGVVFAIVGRAVSDENRPMALAITSATGSVGQAVVPPIVAWLLSFLGWQMVFVILAAAVISILAVLPVMRAPEAASRAELEQSLGAALLGAARDPSYTLIFLGFFACGYQVAFLTAHFPAFVTEACGPIAAGSLLDRLGVTSTAALGAVALSLVGLANIGGTLVAGWAAKHWPKKYILSSIYFGRTIVAAAFILTPMTPATVLLFSTAMGALWLATVPLTSGLVAHIWGVRYMGTLFGFVFLSHQLGSFLGVWLGGRLYDLYGSYDAVWWIGVGIGLFSALVHLPVRERPLAKAA